MSKGNAWDKAYPKNIHWHYEGTTKPVFSMLEEAAASGADKPCLYFLGKRYTYGEVQKLVNQVAYGLQQMGVKKGDKVGLCLPNCPYMVIAYYGALKAGATVVNFNPLYTKDEIRYQIDDSAVSVMFTLDIEPIYEKVAAAFGTSTLRRVIVCPLAAVMPSVKGFFFKILKHRQIANLQEDERHIFFRSLIAKGDTPAAVEIDPAKDIALHQYTGGTTGLPKGAMLTHRNVVSNTLQSRMWLCGDANPGGERFLGVLPFFHVFAMTTVMNLAIQTGSEIILLPRYELQDLLKNIHKLKPTLFSGVPTIFNAILNAPNLSKFDLTSIRFCISGGAPLPVEVKRKFEKLTGCVLVEGYGLSEASPVALCNPLETGGKSGAIGLPLPGTEVEIRDQENPKKVMKVGERGELVIRGPQVMAGYWNRPQESEKVLLKDGYLRTGDVGYMDKDGYVFLTDRLKDIIICSGYKVYPRLVEEVFYKHPDVDEVIVIGIPDDYRGEAPKAFVKLKPHAVVTEQILMDFVSDHLNPIERPSEIEFRDQLPKTMVGKLSKKELVEEEKRKRQSKEK